MLQAGLAVKYKSLRIMGAKAFIEGVDPSHLPKHTSRPFEQIAQERYGPAYQALQRARSQVAKEPKRQTTEDDLRTIDAMIAHLDRRLEATLVRIRTLDENDDDVVKLDRVLARQRSAWAGVKAFDTAVEPIAASLATEPRRTSLQRGREFTLLLKRVALQPTAANFRALKAFGDLHADDRYGRRALEAVARLESASAEDRARYLASMSADEEE